MVFRTERIWLKTTEQLRKHVISQRTSTMRAITWFVRGLFKSTTGTIINADVNGAYNILKKAFLNAFEADRIEDVGLHPSRWRLVTATS